MLSPLSAARIHAQGYGFRDGLGEIGAGVISLLICGNNLLLRSDGNSWWYRPAIVFYLMMFLALIVYGSRIKAALRERITYPRSGYPHDSEARRIRSVVVLLSLLAIVTIFLAVRYDVPPGDCDPDRWRHWTPAVAGLVCGAICVYASMRHGLRRFLVMGVFSGILGAAVCFEYPWRLATFIYGTGIGCALLCSGGVTLWNYLRTAPHPAA